MMLKGELKMRKFIVLVFFIACVVGLVVLNTMPNKQFVSNNVSYSDIDGIFVEIDSIRTYSDITTLVVSWNNKTEYRVTYGNSYSIERLENGKWVDCSIKKNIFTLIGYELNANETVNKEYRLTDMYDVSKPGTYRFLSTCSIDADDKKECFVWAEFIVEQAF